MKVLYFAWMRERVGTGEEDVTPPPGVNTVAALVDWLAGLSPGHARAFENRSVIRCAVNHDFADPGDPVGSGDEVAFFPPVTGG
jgi:molybdopterin synthase sulfur carrier subunit